MIILDIFVQVRMFTRTPWRAYDYAFANTQGARFIQCAPRMKYVLRAISISIYPPLKKKITCLTKKHEKMEGVKNFSKCFKTCSRIDTFIICFKMKNICIEELKTFTKYWGLIFPLLAPVHKGDLPQKFVDLLKFDKKQDFT